MRVSLLAALVLAVCGTGAMGAGVGGLRCEYAVNPIGIDVRQPRLGWMLSSSRRGERQTAYEVLVATSQKALAPGKADLWDSGKVASDESAHVVYGGKPLESRGRCWWTVRVWDRDGSPSAWSKPAIWEMGLLERGDWKGEWIGYPEDPNGAPCPYLRRGFTVSRSVQSARLYATALGLYEPYLNGKRVGSDVFAPGWTDYNKRVMYQTYDVTSSLRRGENALGMIVGDGWYSGFVGLGGRNRYGKQPMVLCQLEVTYADGSRETIASGSDWKAATGPILYSDMLMGETYDARKEIAGWSEPVYAASGWQPVTLMQPANSIAIEAQRGPAVRKTQELAVRTITQPKKGAYVFDLGQNMVGWARLRVRGAAGTTVTLRFAEMLNPDGTIYTTNYRGARCTDHYTLKGGGTEVYEPTFTFRGFRYVELTGYPGTPGKDAVTGVVVHSDTPKTGVFACSSPMVNQLQSNITWGQRGNFLSVPTDCPQRDERLGWMGDAQIFARTAAFNMNVAGFFTKWLVDVDDSQSAEGAFPDVSPRVAAGEGTAAWGDAGVICPWTMYLCYGDKRILEEHYPAMTRWIDYCKSHSNGLIRPNEGYGDWLNINADMPRDVLGTAYFAYSTHLVAKAAAVLGKADDARSSEDLFQQIKEAYNRAFVGTDGRIKGNTQTCYVTALRFDLLPESRRATAARYLVQDIEKRDNHLSTGFVGVGYLLPTLTDVGRTDVAYRLLNNDTFPSWGYSIKYGATTIWERWDGWTKERGFQDPGMNSFNHYSLGSVGQWMYDTLAGLGLDEAAPAYKHIVVRPRLGGGFTNASASLDTLYGRATSAWKLSDGALELDVTVPANTTATVYVPGTGVQEGNGPAEKSEGVRFLRTEDGASVYEVGSGAYRFTTMNR